MNICFLLELRKLLTQPLKNPVAKISATANVLLPELKSLLTKKGPAAPDTASIKEKIYRCQICKNVITGPNAENLYVEHRKTCFNTNSFGCSICCKKFAFKRGLNNHLRSTHLVFE